ncbi:MAG TPA: sulfotransferase [Thermoanaerobaculia bacterium]|nr:sulfotransferase [Thermoanaerobaculia bacterium]
MDKELAPAADAGPIFIIGSPRSGTSILARSLAAHSQLWTSGESYILFDLYGAGRVEAAFERARVLSRGSWFDDQKVTKSEFLRCLGLGVQALFDSRTGGRRWVDHTPHYVLMADTLAEMFPAARFVHILRDGRRVVHSMVHFGARLQREAPSGTEPFVPPWAKDFTVACGTWTTYVEAAMDFCKRNPERAITVVNEELVADTEESFRALFRFIKVPFEKGTVSCFRTHRINSSFQVDSGDLKLVRALSSPWLEWSDEHKQIFARAAGSCMVEHGLAREEDLVTAMPAAAAGEVPARLVVEEKRLADDTPGDQAEVRQSLESDRQENGTGSLEAPEGPLPTTITAP